MKKIILLLFLAVLSFSTYAQKPPKGEGQGQGQKLPKPQDGPNIMGLKIAFITRHLSLSTDEAQKFWPVYYDYSDKVRALRNESKEDELAFEEKLLNERKKFKVEMKKILGTDERANKALSVDREFNNVLKKELENRRMKREMNKENK
ncbi:MAG: hypothetical protein NTZ19_00380 [Bacteroidetes bacterium]|nr:hypothetical protein [Bacteroidota bacterium]